MKIYLFIIDKFKFILIKLVNFYIPYEINLHPFSFISFS